MGKCCGQGGVPQTQGPRGFPQTQGQGGVPRSQVQGGGRCVSDPHDEDVCHGTNERRRDLLDQLKIFLDDFDERPCKGTPPQGRDEPRPLGQYPEYMKKHCQSWMPQNPRPPLITSVQSHEVRVTSDFEKQKNENSEYVSYKDGRSKPPPPSCDCAKRNGLQDQCPRPECTPPTPQCLATNPGPCCPPSLGMTGREARGAAPQTTHRQDFRAQQPPQGQGVHFQSSYRDDYGGPGAAPLQPAWGPAGPTTAPQQMICFCRVPPSTMPAGKKYLCCPLPEN